MTHKPSLRESGSKTLVRKLTIVNRFGIHARPAALFVKTASQFLSEILVDKDGAVVDGKSIMGLLTMEGKFGTVLTVTATGPDAEEALDALEGLIRKKFYEDVENGGNAATARPGNRA